MQTLQLDLGDRSYPIYIGAGLLADAALWRRHIRGRRVCVVSNDTVAPLYLQSVISALSDYQLSTVVLPDGEAHKTLTVLNTIFDTLLAEGHGRDTTLIALGGGVVGDMTGFAAACYQRGVDFLQMPTTLLAMVDSSVGGKTGVNHALGKNMIGAFYQPRCVLADTDTLVSLPPREYAAGLAEVIKYGLICDAPFFDWLEQNMSALVAREASVLTEAIHRSCQSKARIVAADEREGGQRAILNLGHTFGHAIETAAGYGSWLHGEAVAAGMVLAASLSARLGWLADSEVERLRDVLQHAGLPLRPPAGMSVSQFLVLMRRDKKVLDGRLRLVLLRGLGTAVITDAVAITDIQAVLLEAGVTAD